MVVVLYDQNRLEEAQQVCEDLLPMVSSASATEVISTVYLTLSRLQHLQGKQKSAERMLEKLLGILQLGNYERFVSMAVLEMTRQALRTGNWQRLDVVGDRFELAEWVQENLEGEAAMYSQSWERRGLAAVYWLMAHGRNAEAETLLRRLLAVVKGAGIKTRASIIEANLLVLTSKAATATEQSRKVDALITRYGLLNINRSVFDEAPGLAGLMNRLWSAGQLVLPDFYTGQRAQRFWRLGLILRTRMQRWGWEKNLVPTILRVKSFVAKKLEVPHQKLQRFQRFWADQFCCDTHPQ